MLAFFMWKSRQESNPFRLLILFCLFHFASVSPPACAQDSASGQPADPKEFINAASKSNGLVGFRFEPKPWHLMATYQLFDKADSVSDEGTYEEFYVSHTRFKRTLTGNAFTWTDYGTNRGVLQSDSEAVGVAATEQMRRERLIGELRGEFVNPIGGAQSEGFVRFENEGVAALTCLTFGSGNTDCFDAGGFSIRIVQYPIAHTQVNLDQPIKFQGRFIAGNLEILKNHKVTVREKLTKIEEIDETRDADLAPPTDANPPKAGGGVISVSSADYQIDFAPRFAVTTLPKETISSEAAKSFLIVKIPPSYPSEANAAHVTGTVVLEILIGTHGQVKEARALSGPALLQQAAIDAVKGWTYRPDIKNGVAVDMETTVDVDFPWRP